MSSEWINCTLGDCVDVSQGLAINVKSKHLLVDAGLPLLRITDMFNDTYAQFVDTDKAPKKCIAEPEDIIYSRTGQVGFVFTGKKGVVHNNCFKVEPIKPELTKKFVYWFLRQESVRDYANSIASGSVQKDLNHSAFKSIEFSYPSPAAQNRICTLLDTLDSRISLLRETNATLEAIAQALFKSWFVDFDPVYENQGANAAAVVENKEQAPSLPPEIQALFPATFTDSPQGPIPEGWELGTMEDLFVLQRGFDLPSSSRVEGQYPLIAASGPNGTHAKAMVKGPGVVTGRSGVLGKVFFTLEDFWPLNTTLWIKVFKRATPCYAFEVLKRLDTQSFNAGSAVPSLNRNHIHGLPYILPPQALVERYEGIALTTQKKIHENNKQADSLIAIRDTLLPRLISGQLRLSEVEQAIAAITDYNEHR